MTEEQQQPAPRRDTTGTPPIPIPVWRINDTHSTPPHELSPRTAGLIIGWYTSPGDTVVSLGHDPALAGAAGAGGRTYRRLRAPDDLRRVQHLRGTVTLIVVSWPPHSQPGGRSREHLVAMFSQCRELMNRDGCTIVTIAETGTGTYAQHTPSLLPAAGRAGLQWLRHIVAQPEGSPDEGPVHLDVLVFAVARSRHG
ncbi:hypothetical protein AB0F81_41265 [Actinoplanes sp. NPDC024001]|uniref:hypothetical protein n=1 Tax=Actinoplanes sp. NPDC024001 TaxID=3154598 RepID=UPI0033CDE579